MTLLPRASESFIEVDITSICSLGNYFEKNEASVPIAIAGA
jgi:hypothetical protein